MTEPDCCAKTDSAALRRAYAQATLAAAGVSGDAALEHAFASVPREDFLGPGPWRRVAVSRLATLPADLQSVYCDDLFALDVEKGINNGQPSLHAAWLHAANLAPGERVAHIGAGSGYYTAILAQLVGPAGAVVAVEFDARLAAQASANLAMAPNVAVIHGDGALWPREPVDCVYVSFSAARPAAAWLERLKPGGRLIFPLSAPGRRGGGIGLLARRLRGDGIFAVQPLSRVRFIKGEGGQGAFEAPAAERAALAAAFARGDLHRVRSLIWRRPADPARCSFVGEGWALSPDPA